MGKRSRSSFFPNQEAAGGEGLAGRAAGNEINATPLCENRPSWHLPHEGLREEQRSGTSCIESKIGIDCKQRLKPRLFEAKAQPASSAENIDCGWNSLVCFRNASHLDREMPQLSLVACFSIPQKILSLAAQQLQLTNMLLVAALVRGKFSRPIRLI